MKTKMLSPESPWRTVLLVLAVAAADFLMSLIVLGTGLENGTVPDSGDAGIEWIRYAIAPVLAPLGAVALIWRNRCPKSVAAVAAVLGALSFSGIAFFVALFLLARRRLDWWVAAVIVLSIGAEALVGMETLGWDLALVGVVLLGAIAAWGAYRGQRARLLEARLVSLRERAEHAEAERAVDTKRTQLAERHRIAREMHDSLAHRMSLVAVQAGALQVAAADEETADAAKLIRETAHAALGELRDVLGVLHEDGTATAVAENTRTAPAGIERVAGLVAEWRLAGLKIDYTPNPELTVAIADAPSRAAYRVVQEGITNVARHAPEAVVVVTLELRATDSDGTDPDGTELVVSVVNGLGGSGQPAVGAGLGLIGLAERVHLLGGALEHGPTASGFELSAVIPLQQPVHADVSDVES